MTGIYNTELEKRLRALIPLRVYGVHAAINICLVVKEQDVKRQCL